jgi:hypothetical protein
VHLGFGDVTIREEVTDHKLGPHFSFFASR